MSDTKHDSLRELKRDSNRADHEFRRAQSLHQQERSAWQEKVKPHNDRIKEMEEKLSNLDADEADLKEYGIVYDPDAVQRKRDKLLDKIAEERAKLAELDAEGQMVLEPLLKEMNEAEREMKRLKKLVGAAEAMAEDDEEKPAAPPKGSRRRAQKEKEAAAKEPSAEAPPAA